MNKDKNIPSQFLMLTVLIILSAATRLIPHPFNFTAVGAMALFSGANFKDRRIAFLMPVIVMFLTDLIIGFHFSILPVYTCFAFTVWLGTRIKNKQTLFSIVSSSLISSVVFFLVTNLPLWYVDLQLYPVTLKGTMESYYMALPFFKNQVIGDLFYNGLLFGVYQLAFRKKVIPATEKSA